MSGWQTPLDKIMHRAYHKNVPSTDVVPLSQMLDTWFDTLARGDADGGRGAVLFADLGWRVTTHFDGVDQAGAIQRLSFVLLRTCTFADYLWKLKALALMFPVVVDCTTGLTGWHCLMYATAFLFSC